MNIKNCCTKKPIGIIIGCFVSFAIILLLQSEFEDANSSEPHSTLPQKVFVEVERAPDIFESMQQVLNAIKTNHSSKNDLLHVKSMVEETMNVLKNKLEEPVSKFSKTLDVCPESYVPTSEGYPFWMHNRKTVNCSNSKQIGHVISILIDAVNSPQENISLVLNMMHNVYPTVKIVIGISTKAKNRFLNSNVIENSGIKVVYVRNTAKPGNILSQLKQHVKTPYILIARKLFYFNWFANLERQIRVLSDSPNLVVAGGAVRNKNALWKIGCYQMETRSHMLKYIEGYYTSQNECQHCDMITGPFVIKKSALESLKISEKLEEEFMYLDMFLQIKEKELGIFNCPDVMYFSSNENFEKVVNVKANWIALATEWQFDIIRINNKVKHAFTCSQIKYTCNMMNTKNFILPTCCFDKAVSDLLFFTQFAEKYNIRYELGTGSVLAAVKMADMMPWDLDGDIHFASSNYSVIKSHSKEFKDNSVRIGSWENTLCCDKNGDLTKGYFQISSPIYFEMFGLPKLSTETFLPKELEGIPTKVKLHGVTVNGPVNPGLYARNRYGKEIFKHAQSWILLGNKNSHVPYKAGVFSKCARKNFHACLDKHPTDGNIPFNVNVL